VELFPYQHEGVDWLADNTRAGLFDEPGLGKTAQTIRALNRVGARRIIVVCPAAVREVWLGEFRKFSETPLKILKGDGARDLYLFQNHKVDALLLSYERATKWAPRLEFDLYDAIVFDESHYLKGHDTLRTRAMLGVRCDGVDGLARWAARVWFLSGTPAPNEPADIWTFLRFVGGTELGFLRFSEKYFTAAGKLRRGTVQELKGAISKKSFRRTKKQVDIQLPPIWLTNRTVDGDTKEIAALLREYPGLEDEILRAVERGGLSFLDAQHIGTLRRLVGEAKAPAFVETIADELTAGTDKVVVFGLHKKALEIVRTGLTDRGIGVVHIDGSVPEAQRIRAVESFQNDPETRVFVGQIRAAGTGLTLTAADTVIMLETDWAPAANAQALMRVHRIGQTRAVRASFVTLANSIDERVTATVARKTRDILQLGFDDGLTG
jgi:SWI/SNF-related matrix-associated actin-dependent regulator 1 of chromatin subfamily A